MFSSLDALIINSSCDTQNIKNTINLFNANLKQGKQLKELKKRKAIKSL